VASVVGTIFFVLVFIGALGALDFASNQQQMAALAQQDAEENMLRRSGESLVFTASSAGLQATNEGPTTIEVNHVILKFPNGTVYPLAALAALPSGGTLPVRTLIPAGQCVPGTATCLSKYEHVVAGSPPGSSVGVLTSMGNTFWYAYAAGEVSWSSLTGFPRACPPGQAISQLNTTVTCSASGALVATAKTAATSSGTSYSTTGLQLPLPPNMTYAFYVFTAVEPYYGIEDYNFEVHALPAGATLVIACAPMAYPYGGGNLPTNCVSAAGTPIAAPNSLGFGVAPPVFATPGIFGVVTMGSSGGTLQIDFACTANCGGVSVKAGSFIVALPVS
jgi:hypothetical protein